MNRIITLKGTGNISVKPDLIIITMDLESHKYDYEKTMELAAESVSILQNAIETAGFDKKDLKQPILILAHIMKAIGMKTTIIKIDLTDMFVSKG